MNAIARERPERIKRAVKGPAEVSVRPDRAKHYMLSRTPSSSGTVPHQLRGATTSTFSGTANRPRRDLFRVDNGYGAQRPAPSEFVERNAGACSLMGKPKPAPPSRRSRSYLRDAEAYMLTSMPTCTSTIFGVSQVIGVLLGQQHDCRGPACTM
jgi:hypothetical protein